MSRCLRFDYVYPWRSVTSAVVCCALLHIAACSDSHGTGRVDVPAEAPDISDAGGRDCGDDSAQGDVAPDLWNPTAPGPFPVGVTELHLHDPVRDREVRTVVWYPAAPDGQETAVYLLFVEGTAFVDAPADLSAAPYPMVLFSHGFAGIAEQSITLMEHLAGHGYVVAAMDHEGNMIKDAGADDDEVAAVALERPYDLRFAYEEVAALAATSGHLLSGLADPESVAVAGHSFGGYTALLAAGGTVDVDAAQVACDAGTAADIFCPYIPFWPAGEVVALDPPLPHLDAVFTLCPGGSAAFGPQGLAGISVPALIFGGSRDETTPMDIEVHPIYESLPPPKAEAVIADAAHLSFTNICDIPIAAEVLDDFCGVEGMRGADGTFPIVNALATAFLDIHLKGDASHAWLLDQEALDAYFGAVTWTVVP